MFKVNRPVRASKVKTYATGYEGAMPELTVGDVESLAKCGAISLVKAKEPATVEPTEAALKAATEERLALIKVAVAEAMDADPARETQPTIKAVEAILEFNGVRADEITVAYEAIKAEMPGNDNGGSNPTK